MAINSLDDQRFLSIVEILTARARHLLEREERIGSTMRLIGKTRIGDDELRARIQRLRVSIRTLLKDFNKYWTEGGNHVRAAEVFPSLTKAESCLSFDRLSSLLEADIETRLLNLCEALDIIMLQSEVAMKEAMSALSDPALKLLTPAELAALEELTIEELTALEEFPKTDHNVNQKITILTSLNDSVAQCRSETRAIIAGRFQAGKARGAPEKLRGQRLAIQLLGMSEAFGLFNSRDHHGHKSGIDAVILALQPLANHTNKAALVILKEVPKTHDAFARHLLPKARTNEWLLSEWRLGRALGERMELPQAHRK